jgi:spermidine/putrescine transport system ATP-binding protein
MQKPLDEVTRSAGETGVIAFKGVSKHYGNVIAVDNIDLAIEQGTFVSILGPSGCGKTTTLRMVAGFEHPTAGEVFIEGVNVTGLPAYRRPVNMVFQHYALFPHLDVFDNVAYGLRQRVPRPDPDEIRSRVGAVLELVRLSGLERRRAWELSGGQQQRVALARALINRPSVLLLDEPLAALDRKLRRDMQFELQNLQRNVGITFVLVTHDQEEALSMSDRVCIMRQGRIVQVGTPRQLYDEPVNRYVADFVGKTNFIDGSLVSLEADGTAQVRLANGRISHGRSPAAAPAPPIGAALSLAIRPELISLDRDERVLGEDAHAVARATVRNCIFLGEQTEYLVEAEGLGKLLVLTPKRLETETGGYAPGDQVYVGWSRTAALILPDN